jgi:hypothetical protein
MREDPSSRPPKKANTAKRKAPARKPAKKKPKKRQVVGVQGLLFKPTKKPGKLFARLSREELSKRLTQVFTPEIQEELFELLADGSNAYEACHFVGISYNTWVLWMKQGRRALVKYHAGVEDLDDDEEERARFFIECNRARAQADVEDVKAIKKAGEWTARAWRAERRSPKRWGRRSTTVHEGNPERPLQVEQVENEIRSRIDRIATRARAAEDAARADAGPELPAAGDDAV